MTDKLREAALWKLLTEAREALWQPANPDLCGRIDEALAQQDAQCGLCGADRPFTGSCGGGRENPRALCFADRVPLAQQDAQAVPTQRQYEMALRQWDHWKSYALELQAKLVKYEGGSPMVLNAAPTPPAQQDAQAVRQGWQPIETAPRDGTVIDLWHEEFGREADCYWGLPHHCCGEMGSLCDSDWHSLEPGWVGTFNEIMSPANAYTHWMPLPPAPDAAPTPPAQRVMLTDDEIEDLARGKSGHSDFARAVIEAYEKKNGIK